MMPSRKAASSTGSVGPWRVAGVSGSAWAGGGAASVFGGSAGVGSTGGVAAGSVLAGAAGSLSGAMADAVAASTATTKPNVKLSRHRRRVVLSSDPPQTQSNRSALGRIARFSLIGCRALVIRCPARSLALLRSCPTNILGLCRVISHRTAAEGRSRHIADGAHLPLACVWRSRVLTASPAGPTASSASRAAIATKTLFWLQSASSPSTLSAASRGQGRSP